MNAFLKFLAIPFSWLYGAIVWIRNQLYNNRIFYSHHVSIPTICVGNLAVGGTGKTPMVEYLVSELSPHYKVAIVSRGYKRKTHGFVLASPSSTVESIGDEPMQMHIKFPTVPIAVCKDRVEAIHRLQRQFPDLDVVILDDALQYRRLKCGFNILLTAADNLYVDDHYLPLGRLRDSRSEYLRANVIVVTKCPDSLRPIDKRILDNRLKLPTYQHLYFSRVQYPDIAWQGNPLIVAGVAHPQYFIEYVRRQSPDAEVMLYNDHHKYTKADMELIEQNAQYYGSVLTTEKDYTRLREYTFSDSLQRKLVVVPIRVEISEPDLLLRQLTTYINENRRHV